MSMELSCACKNLFGLFSRAVELLSKQMEAPFRLCLDIKLVRETFLEAGFLWDKTQERSWKKKGKQKPPQMPSGRDSIFSEYNLMIADSAVLLVEVLKSAADSASILDVAVEKLSCLVLGVVTQEYCLSQEAGTFVCLIVSLPVSLKVMSNIMIKNLRGVALLGHTS